jgi:hypothetical protein
MTAVHRFNNGLRYRDPNDDRQVQYTPQWLLEEVRKVLGSIDVDPCTTDENPVGAARFFVPEHDGLKQPWHLVGNTSFVNPPYGKAREPWVAKAIEEAARGMRIILLMPAHPDTRCFQKAVRASTDVLFLRGRLKFGVLRENRRQAAASHPSALFGFGVSLLPLQHLGLVMTQTNSLESESR